MKAGTKESKGGREDNDKEPKWMILKKDPEDLCQLWLCNGTAPRVILLRHMLTARRGCTRPHTNMSISNTVEGIDNTRYGSTNLIYPDTGEKAPSSPLGYVGVVIGGCLSESIRYLVSPNAWNEPLRHVKQDAWSRKSGIITA